MSKPKKDNNVVVTGRDRSARTKKRDEPTRSGIKRGPEIIFANPNEKVYVYHIKSEDSILNQAPLTTDFNTQFLDTITFRPDQVVRIRVLDAYIPHSFYNITTTSFDIDGTTYTVPDGNYNVFQLRDAILEAVVDDGDVAGL